MSRPNLRLTFEGAKTNSVLLNLLYIILSGEITKGSD
jgi:hypothetical protein